MRQFNTLGWLALLSTVSIVGAHEKPKSAELPPGARKAVADADVELEKARKKFQAEVKAIRAKLIADLQKQLEAETKKGNLDGGLAIRGEIERLKQPDPKIEGEEPALAAAKKVLVGGKWRLTIPGTAYQADWEFHNDGRITNSDRGSQDVKWTIETQAKGKVLRVGVATFPLPLDSKKIVGSKTTSNERVELNKLSNK
jgi:hypothetical protein